MSTKRKEVIHPKSAFDPQVHKDFDPQGQPWSQAVRVGDLLFLAGQGPLDLHGKVLGPGDMVKQTEKTLENLKAILEEMGGSLDDVLHTTWYCTNIEDFYKKGCSHVRWEYYQKNFPTSTLAGVTRLAHPSMMVELTAIARVGGPKKEVIHPKSAFDPQVHKDFDPQGQPWSQAVRWGDLLFLAGQGSLDLQGKTVGEADLVKQTRQTMENLKSILEETGGSLDDILHTTWYCNNIDDFYKKGCSHIRWEYYKENFPTSTLAGVTRLAHPSLMVELTAIARLGGPRKEILHPRSVFNPQRHKHLDPRGQPWSHAVRFGNLLFLSGQVSVDREGKIVGKGDMVKQTEQTFENLKAILEETGGSLDDVVHTIWYCTNIEDFYKKGCSHVRWNYYKKDFPTSTLAGVTRLADPSFMVEVEAIAVTR